MSEWKWVVPQGIRDVLDSFIDSADNLGLLLDKFTPYAHYQWETNGNEKDEWRLGFVTHDDREREVKLEKGDWLRYAVGQSAINKGRDQEARKLPFDATLIKAYQKRWRAACTAYAPGPGYIWEMTTAAPLIVGLGAKHILDTGITLDRNTGLPIIPGSALKGLARTIALIDLAKQMVTEPTPDDLPKLDNWLAEKTDWKDLASLCRNTSPDFKQRHTPTVERFRKQFGFRDQVGGVIFMDGIYAGTAAPKYAVDIMNVHYKNYYGAKQAPSDDQKLNPITYLTVAASQKFNFAVLPRTQTDTAYVPVVRKYLETGLKEEYGIGAKTAQGYGVFTEP
jgi:CRISPR-associated protein Cmr6